ncbi:hypothetical protein EGR_00504 [Echinococcus granulosus]|uniref:Uncharacterized protein n=1 Tax=Echinococcus granulosus TaxID=6210 RepID=W6VCF1_ECHGR|nr:hypothetical protein EGR_00504 [Echinococcus granulosus]EUB64554.1 hypothetical protein EGR_00504 [Echinococcus granulosus]
MSSENHSKDHIVLHNTGILASLGPVVMHNSHKKSVYGFQDPSAYQDCEKCPAIKECEIVVCSSEERSGKLLPITSESCELSCSQVDISCRRFPNGRLDWYPFNPCAVTTTTSTTTTTTSTTTTAAAPIDYAPPSFDYQNALETTVQIPLFFPSGSTSGDMLHDIEPVFAPAESTAQQKKQSYGLSWLVSEPELELILWVMFGVALILILIGFIGLGGFVCYRRWIKKQIKITTCPRYYDASRQRAYGIVAYDAGTYGPGLEYEKLRGSNGTCYWAQRTESREPGTIRRIPSPQISICSPFCSTNRHGTARVDHNYVHHMSIPSTSYRLTDSVAPINSAYHLVTFAPTLDTMEGSVTGKPTTCMQDISCIHGLDTGALSLDGHQRTVLTVTPDRHITGGAPSMSTTSPIPMGNDTFLMSTYHRTNSFRNEVGSDAEPQGEIIQQQQTKV